MQLESNPLEDLARRVRHGEAGATEEFRREMSVALEGMVRLALRKRGCFNPFEESARARALRLLESSGWLPTKELACRVAGAVCEDMIGRLQAGGRLRDTVAWVRAGSRSSRYQTVLAAC